MVEFHHVCQKPCSMLLAAAFGWFVRHVAKKPFHQSVRAFSPLTDSLARIARFDERPLDFRSACHQLTPEVLQPVSETKSGNAVLAIVSFDGIAYFFWDVRGLDCSGKSSSNQR